MALHLTRLRLQAQQIAAPLATKPEDVVKQLLAVQAQDYLGSLWAIGLRMKKGTEAIVEQAVASRQIVRSWPMRGTLHFVMPADLRWMLKLLAPRVIARAAGIYRQAGVDYAVVAKSRKLFLRALDGGQSFTRPEMYDVLERAQIRTDKQRGLHIMGYLAQEGLLCLGPRQGKQHTFVLLEEWLPPAKVLTPDESLVELTRRYFRGHGPASVHDFAWWSGLTLTEAKKGLAMADTELIKDAVNGTTYWMWDLPAMRSQSAGYLLPAYDEFTVAYKDRSAFLDPEHIVLARNGIFSPVIIVNGKIAGTWKRTIRNDKVLVKGKVFDISLKPNIIKAIEKYGEFLGLDAELQIT